MSRKSLNLVAGLFLAAALVVAPVHAVAQAVATSPASTVAASAAVSVPLAEPQTYTEAGNDVIAAVRLYKTGYWVGLALVVSQLLVFAMKRIEQVQPQFKKYGTTIILGLSAVTAFLGFLVGGHSVPETVLLFLGTAAPKLLADVMTELGVTPHRDDAAPVAPPAAPPAA